MKKIVFILVAVLSFGAVSAQEKVKVQSGQQTKQTATKEDRAKQYAGRLYKELGLTDEQREKVYSAKLEMITNREALDARYADKVARDQHKAEYNAIQQTFDSKMKIILTPEQYTKFSEHREQRMRKTAREGASK